MAGSSTWVFSLKALLISIGVVSIAVMMKFSVPLVMSFLANEVPLIWSILISWLRPPYLYFVINGIIITIAATSRFHHKNESEAPIVPPKPPHPDLTLDYAVPPQQEFGVASPTGYESGIPVPEVKTVVMEDPEVKTVAMNGPKSEEDEDEEEEEEAFVISKSTWTPPKRMDSSDIQPEYLLPVPEKPPVSSRIGHRKPLKVSPEGGRAALRRVAKPKKQETLESTWKTITDGRHVPLRRHLRKSDTWEHDGRPFNIPQPQYHSPPVAKKSETFRDRTNYDPNTPSPGSGKLRKEPSPSQEELNRRVEAFIKKFNEEMRLQRQESVRQYLEMINRGAH
ncbi:uncharacterized protein LOC127808363 [Diospyros lotus]|uniref:uncharacterized protein LOC127808363 n=1 Tax=Diospyros lotus TaxID=55363 RepID=UPI0022538102|nr:uncharacterized protein LOC127808363 [Diospyros lotus]